jgi:hypothetical protein
MKVVINDPRRLWEFLNRGGISQASDDEPPELGFSQPGDAERMIKFTEKHLALEPVKYVADPAQLPKPLVNASLYAIRRNGEYEAGVFIEADFIPRGDRLSEGLDNCVILSGSNNSCRFYLLDGNKPFIYFDMSPSTRSKVINGPIQGLMGLVISPSGDSEDSTKHRIAMGSFGASPKDFNTNSASSFIREMRLLENAVNSYIGNLYSEAQRQGLQRGSLPDIEISLRNIS